MLFSWPLEKFKTIKKSIPFYVIIVSFFVAFVISFGAGLYIRSAQIDENEKLLKAQTALIVDVLQKWITESHFQGSPRRLEEWSKSYKKSEIIIWNEKGKGLWHSDKEIAKILALYAEDSNRKYKDVEKLKNTFQEVREASGKERFIKKEDPGSSANSLYSFHRLDVAGVSYYVQISMPLAGISYLTLCLWSLLFSFATALIMGGASETVAGGLLKPLEAMRSSLGYYRKTGQGEVVHYYSDNEIGKLIAEFNSCVNQFKTGSLKPDLEPQVLDRLTAIIQQKLFEHPFPRLQGLEAALYPRISKNPVQKFFSATQNDNVLYIFLGHYDINSIDSALQKHRLQEQFFALVRAGVEGDKIAQTLWNHMFTHMDLGPGLMFFRWDFEGNDLQMFRSGPFEIFARTSEGFKYLPYGEDYFVSEFTGLSRVETTEPEALVVITEETLDHLEMEPGVFAQRVLDSFSVKNGAGESLASLLDTVSSILPIGDDFSGLLSYITKR